jgi:hypothetical protein
MIDYESVSMASWISSCCVPLFCSPSPDCRGFHRAAERLNLTQSSIYICLPHHPLFAASSALRKGRDSQLPESTDLFGITDFRGHATSANIRASTTGTEASS